MPMVDRDKLQCCNFCGKNVQEVRKLIAGPNVYICTECIELCVDIVIEDAGRAEVALAELAKEPKPVDMKALTWLKKMAADRPIEDITVQEFVEFVFGKLERYALRIKRLQERRELEHRVENLRREQRDVTAALENEERELAQLVQFLEGSAEAATKESAPAPAESKPA